MLESLKEEVFEANRELVRQGLVTLTWGNASGISGDQRYFVIKPSGVPYDNMSPDDMVVLNLDGKVVEGKLRPSSDMPTHLLLYKEFPEIGGVVHTHSLHATTCAQARFAIPCLGTTHADHFHGTIPITRPLSPEEVKEAYEHNTGLVIAKTLRQNKGQASLLEMPAVLVAGHGPFTWGENVSKAVENAVALEAVAKMAIEMHQLSNKLPPLEDYVLEKHYQRKHGKNAYYGQPKHKRK